MENFYFWISQFSKAQAIALIFALLLCMVLLPYATFIVKAAQILIRKKKLEVLSFDYFVSKEQIAYAQSVGGIKLPEPDFIMEGSPVILHWRVEGAIQVRLLPGIGKVTGDAAEVLVSRNRRHFTLEVKGIFSKQNLQIEIPLDKIKTLESAYISEFEVHTQIENITSYPITQSDLLNNSFIRKFPEVNRYSRWNLNVTRKLINHRPNNNLIYKANIDNIIFNQKITKSYSFSTQKYNSHNQFKPLNS
jgi:hypothetical protein